jgi:DNA-binding transcriptional LysR family regulator
MSLGKAERIQVFIAVAEAESFARAARRLNLSPSVVTRLVAELEAQMGVQLLVRTTRKVALTAAGREFLEKSKAALAALEEAEEEVRQHQNALRGEIRISAPLSFGQKFLAPAISRFRILHDQVTLKLTLDDSFVDLGEGRFDMALRIAGPPKDQSVIARNICLVPRVLVASPKYIARRGKLREPRELAQHDCMGYSNLPDAVRWSFTSAKGETQSVNLRFCMECNNGDVLAGLAALGEGIALLPRFIVEERLAGEKLVEVLGDWRAPEIWLTATYPPFTRLPAKVKAFTAFIEDALSSLRLQGS